MFAFNRAKMLQNSALSLVNVGASVLPQSDGPECEEFRRQSFNRVDEGRAQNDNKWVQL